MKYSKNLEIIVKKFKIKVAGKGKMSKIGE